MRLTDSAVLLAIKPRFTSLILSGSKTIEFRRTVPVLPVKTIAIYCSSPVQSIVGTVEVLDIVAASPSKLWSLSRQYGGGLSRTELFEYFDSKKAGFAFMLGTVRTFDKPIRPARIIRDFSAPQSFRYLSSAEMTKLEAAFQ